MFSHEGIFIKFILDPADDETSEDDVLHWARGIVVDKKGNILIADTGKNCLKLLSPEGNRNLTPPRRLMVLIGLVGKVKRRIGSHGEGEGQMNIPQSPLIDQEGNIIFCDTSNHRIQVYGGL